MGRYALGAVCMAFRPMGGAEASAKARDLGFDHFDPMLGDDQAGLALPVGIPITMEPKPGWCLSPSPPAGDGQWERAVEQWRAAPGCLLEPYPGGCVNSLEAMRAMAEEVPGLRFLVDTGHVATWGGDPLEVVELATHVQLRQAAPGLPQLHADDPRGVVDFEALFRRLDAIEYPGKLSIEYFDFPDFDMPLEDPLSWAVDLDQRVRPLLG